MKRLIYTLLIIFCFSYGANAQSKLEIKLFNKIIQAKKTKDIKKFLKKYSNSVYAPTIVRLRDSINFYKIDSTDLKSYILFSKTNPSSFFSAMANDKIAQLTKSSLNPSQAKEFAIEAGLNSEKIASVAGIKDGNKEYILAILLPDENLSYEIVKVEKLSGKWGITDSFKEQRNISDYNLEVFEIKDKMKPTIIDGETFIYYTYLNKSNKLNKLSLLPNNNIEYVLNLYSPSNKSVTSIIFSGRTEFASNNTDIIYGSCLDISQGNDIPAPISYLNNQINNSPNLKPYTEGNFIDQDIIEWWYNNNPSKTNQLNFGILPDNSKIIDAYKLSKEKVNVGKYIVSYFDLYNTTMVIVYDKSDKKYSIAYCLRSQIARKDLMLNNIFAKGNSAIELYFYEGNKLIKKTINLASKRIY